MSTDVAVGAEGAASKPSLRRRAVRALCASLAVGLLLWTMLRQREEIVERAGDLSAVALVTAFAAVLIGLVCSMLAWRSMLAGLGSNLPLSSAARVFFFGQLGKYLPGGGWAVLGHMELARDLAVPRKRAVATTVLTLGTGVLSGVVIAGSLLAVPGSGSLRSPWWLLVVPPALVCLLDPRILAAGFSLLLRAARRRPLDHPPSRGNMHASVGWSVAMWLCFGAQIWILARDLGAEGGTRLAVDALGGFAVAWLAGFIAPLAPAGIGFREAVLGVGLGSTLSAGSAALVALTSRVLLTLGDLVAAAVAGLTIRLRRGRRAAERRRPDPSPSWASGAEAGERASTPRQ